MIYLTVACLTFGLKSSREIALRKRMEHNYANFFTETDGNNTPIFIVDADSKITTKGQQPITVFNYSLAEDNACLKIYADRRILTIHHTASGNCFSIECGTVSENNITVYKSDLAAQSVAPPHNILDHLLLFALSMSGLHHNMLLIHASSTVYNGKAMMFLGESGTGKSTHSRMWLENISGTTLLNDDAPAVRLLPDGTVRTYGTPWSGKTPCYMNTSYPLEAFVRIKRAQYNRLTRQDTIHPFRAVLPSCLPTLQQDETTLDPLCDILSSILANVPVYVMECLPDGDAARVCCNGLFEYKQ